MSPLRTPGDREGWSGYPGSEEGLAGLTQASDNDDAAPLQFPDGRNCEQECYKVRLINFSFDLDLDIYFGVMVFFNE